MHIYCPFAGCGHKATYEVTKPTTCPRCQKRFADAFKVVTPVAAPIAYAPVSASIPTAQPRLRASLLKARAAKAAKQRPEPLVLDDDPEVQSHIMNLPPGEAAPEDEDQFEGDEGGEDVSIRAQELAASIDPSTIRVNTDSDEWDTKFATFWAAGKAARESAEVTPQVAKPVKRRGRR